MVRAEQRPSVNIIIETWSIRIVAAISEANGNQSAFMPGFPEIQT